MLPMAVPGLVLGLGYIFFFNAPGNPLNGLYHTLTLLTLCTIVHFYTTGHLTAVTALKALDAEFESVSASLKVPFYKTFWRVTLPICTPALVDIARYFFVNAMTTISAVVFLYSPETKVASIAILNLDEAGETGAAAAMALLIAAASTVATLLFMAPVVAGRTPHPGLEATLEGTDPMDRDRILLTPGPLTTTLRTKLAMLRDWGSWDADFNAVTARLRAQLLDIVHGQDTHVVVPLQGSGTFSVEAAVATVVPRDGHVLVLDNGAYCKRAAKLTQMMGRKASSLAFAEDAAVSAGGAGRAAATGPAASRHVVLIHCETGTGVLNPLAEVAAVCERHGKGLIVDAMSSFGALPIDAREHALRRAGRRQRQVPGRRARHGLRLPAQGHARRLRRQQPEPGDGPVRPAAVHGEDRASGASRRRRT